MMHSKPFRYSPLAGVTVVERVLFVIFLVFLVELHHPAEAGWLVSIDGRFSLESGAVQPKHDLACADQLINNEAIFTKTKQVQSRNIAVVDEKLNDEREHDV